MELGRKKTEWQLWTCDEGLSHETSKITGTGKGELPNKDEQAQEGLECFNCHKKGHYSSKCPNNAMLCVERTVNGGVISKIKEQRLVKQLGTLKYGVVEGKSVRDIHLDTGCSRTMIH